MLRAFKYRIYPTQSQADLLNQSFGCARFYWNNLVATFNTYNKETNPNPVYRGFTEVRNDPEMPWMLNVSAAVLQNKDRNFRALIKQYFSKTRKTKIGRPQFKKKSGRQSYQLSYQKSKCDFKNKIYLEKIGWITALIDYKPKKDFNLRSITVSKNPDGKFYASVLVETQIIKHKPTGKEVGIDLGITNFVISSDNKKFNPVKPFRKNQAKLKKLQKKFSRKKKGSNRRRKLKVRVARLHQKISNQRQFLHHQISSYLIKTYDTIYIEDLNVSGMVKNRKLAKSIQDAGWSNFIKQLTYKAKWHNKTITKINRFYPSSKICNICGVKNDLLQLKDREWTCSCGVKHDRDLNAALNILKEGKKITQEIACV